MFESKTYYDPVNKIWYSDSIQPIFNTNLSIGHVILYMLERESDKVLQISANNGMQFTGGELSDLTVRIAINLQKKGLQQEDVIGIIASNSHYLAPFVFAALLCGIPINTLDPSFDKGEIKHMFGITKPKMIICDAGIYETVSEALKEILLKCPIYTIKGKVNGIGSIEEFLTKTGEEDDFLPPQLKNGGDQIAAILCSSGTTGLPKGVCVSHAMLLSQTVFPILNNVTALCFSTLYWLSGIHTLLLGTIAGAKRIIIDEPFSPEVLLRLIEEYKVSYLLTPPSQMALAINCPDIKKRDLSSLNSYLCGGSVVPVTVAKEMETYLPNGQVKVGYGMTEVAGVITFEQSLRKRGSVGQVAFNAKIKIIDDNGRNLDINEDGEICIKIASNCLGYYGNEKATKDLIDNDGWIHSGDIGHFDDEGFLFITDRKKEILKYKNFHFYPAEIENVIRQIPDVVDVCVCGIPDIIATDLPAAAIIKKKNSKLNADDVYDFVANKMAHFKHLRGGVYFVDSLPMTPSGKIQRRKVRDILEKLYQQQKQIK